MDLDETMIHCSQSDQKLIINYRPHLELFLQEMDKYYNLVLFTASEREYAEKILNKIDSESKYIQNVLARENCLKYKNAYIKDFRIIANRHVNHKEDIVMLDNKVVSFGYNINQGVPILPFYENLEDCELRGIIPFLIELSSKKVSLKDRLKVRYNYGHKFSKLYFPS